MYIFLAEKYARWMNKRPASKKVYSVRLTLFGGGVAADRPEGKGNEQSPEVLHLFAKERRLSRPWCFRQQRTRLQLADSYF